MAKEDKERYATIIKIVASYIRQTREGGKIKADGIDIEAALSVIKGRHKKWDNIPSEPRQYVFDLSNARLADGDLSSTHLNKVNMSDLTADNFGFESTYFKNTNMVSATFKGCDFTGCKFSGTADKPAELMGAKFLTDKRSGKPVPCNFEKATLNHVDLSGADLSEVSGLTQEQLKNVHWDEDKEPTWPHELGEK